MCVLHLLGRITENLVLGTETAQRRCGTQWVLPWPEGNCFRELVVSALERVGKTLNRVRTAVFSVARKPQKETFERQLRKV